MSAGERQNRERPARALSATAPLSVALAYGVGFWVVLLHHLEGGHEHGEPGLLLHWLRDSTLALPAIVTAAWLAAVLAGRALSGRGASEGKARAASAAAIALSTSLVFAGGIPVHGWLFGAHEGHELPLLVHVLRDTLLALAVALPIARGLPWLLTRARGLGPASPATPRRVIPRCAFAAALLALTAVATGAQASGDSPGTPCPASAPVKNFTVVAIDVDIPLNRFGDHDPKGKMYVLASRVADVRAQEASRQVSIGLRNDAIQPLVIRANLGECVEITFRNDASGGDFGLHIDGISFEVGSSGDAVGNNPPSGVPRGQTRGYRYWIPPNPVLEGAHAIRPGAGFRAAVNHGLLGALVVEPAGSHYLDPNDTSPGGPREIESGWEAMIDVRDGAEDERRNPLRDFREAVQVWHEVGNENETIQARTGGPVPLVDPTTDSYRPGTRAINYRSESFMNRMLFDKQHPENLESLAYGSYTFGDPATPMMRGYVKDPTKIRILHGGSEVFHVFHLHGGGIRWPFQSHADPGFDYGRTGLDRAPNFRCARKGRECAPSARLDSQVFGPGEAFDLQVEGGAGGFQQAVGEFAYHCHIPEHYVSGMWSFWRVQDTLQPDLEPLPDRAAPPNPVTSAELIGRKIEQTRPDGTVTEVEITQDNLDEWVEPQLPPPGVPNGGEAATGGDASVWNWRTVEQDGKPLYVGEPEDVEHADWANMVDGVAGHPGSFPGDRFVRLPGEQSDRPIIFFNPENGRPVFPFLRPHIGKRPPFAPNRHSGAPYLGEEANLAPARPVVDPFAGRIDGLCPAGAPERAFNVVSIQLPVKVTRDPDRFDEGKIFVLADDKEDFLAGRRAPEPLAIRTRPGECVDLTLTTELPEEAPEVTKSNLHIHHVNFDPPGSDGAVFGLNYEMTIRTFEENDPQLAADAHRGDREIALTSVEKFVHEGNEEGRGIGIAIGQGTPRIEINEIRAVNRATSTVTLVDPLEFDHPRGAHAGVEFVRARWFADVGELDNIFFHDHIDPRRWPAGLVGQLIVEPAGSTFHDPQSGAEVRSGAIVDIRCETAACRANPLVPGLVDGSFREFVAWTAGGNVVTDSVINLRAEPFADRGGDPSLRFSSWAHGDPWTPIPRAYAGDSFVVRLIDLTPTVPTFHVDQHRFYTDYRFFQKDKAITTPSDTLHIGISERFTLILEGGAGKQVLDLDPETGEARRDPITRSFRTVNLPGDYLYWNGIARRFRHGAWGIIRAYERNKRVTDDPRTADVDPLQPLPGHDPPVVPLEFPASTGPRPPQAPPETRGPGTSACPLQRDPETREFAPIPPVRHFSVSAVDVSTSGPGGEGRRAAFVLTRDAAAVKAGTKLPEPLVLHVRESECVVVRFKNERQNARASFHLTEFESTAVDWGVNAGFEPVEQTLASGESRDYLFFVARHPSDFGLGQLRRSALVSDFGGDDSGRDGLYGAAAVAPFGSTFHDPVSGVRLDRVTAVDRLGRETIEGGAGAKVDVRCDPRAGCSGFSFAGPLFKFPGIVHGEVEGYRDFTVILADRDPQIGSDFMPYPERAREPALVNYQSATVAGTNNVRPDDGTTFSSSAHGDPPTPRLEAYAGDPTVVHALVAPGSEQMHVFSLGGLTWPRDPRIDRTAELASQAIGPWEGIDALIVGGAGGRARTVGDFFYGDLRRPFTQIGMWGLIRVLGGTAACPSPGGGLQPLPGLGCDGLQPRPDVRANPINLEFAPSTTTKDLAEAGDTTLKVFSTSGFPLSGSVFVEGRRIDYTGTTDGSFTGIPASGQGAIVARIGPSTPVDGEVVVSVANDRTRSVSLTNEGSDELAVERLEIAGADAGEFSVAPGSCTATRIVPGGDCELSVTYTPRAGRFQDEVTRDEAFAILEVIYNSEVGSPHRVPLRGFGRVDAPRSFRTLFLGFRDDVPIGSTSAPRTVTVTNVTTSPQTVTQVELIGKDRAAFAIRSNGCAGVELSPGSSCPIQLTFTPSAADSHFAALILTDGHGSPHRVRLLGIGRQP